MLAVFYMPLGYPHRLKTLEVTDNSRATFMDALARWEINPVSVESVIFIDNNGKVVDQYEI